MSDRKLKILEQILAHLDNSQGKDFKSLLDDENKPEVAIIEESEILPVDSDSEESEYSEKPEGEEDIDSLMGKPKADEDEEMTDDELQEMLSKHLKK